MNPGEQPANKGGPVITLINPPHIQPRGLFPSLVFQPVGLAYVAAALEREGYQVSVLDALALGGSKPTPLDGSRQLVGMTYEAIEGYLRGIAPDIVGIGVPFTAQAESALAVASTVKRMDSRILTILGGPHATSYPLDCLRHPDVDIVVRGEGEGPTVNLVSALKSGAGLGEILGIGFKEAGSPKVNPMSPPVIDLDSLPFPARHLLPMEKYFEAARSMRTARLDNFNHPRFANVITSRGCPFKCVFCSTYLLMGRRWRFRSAENVVQEIQQLVEGYGVNFINFEDDNMTLNRERMARICDLLLDRGLRIHWDTPNGVRADTLDEELLYKMKASGCREICIAPESGNQWVVDHIVRKQIDLKKVEEVARLGKKVGLRVDAFFVIGMVGETRSQIQDTIEFARKLRKLGVTKVHFHIATPFEGTELYQEAHEKGYLTQRGEELRIETPEFTMEDIDRLYNEGMKLNPRLPPGYLRLALKTLVTHPLRFFRLAFAYLLRRQVRWA